MRKVRFRQADLQRVLRAAKREGVAVEIEIEPATGKMIVTTRSDEGEELNGARHEGKFRDIADVL